MAENSLFPAYVVIDYHSTYAPHKMTIPTLEWNSGGTYGDFATHAAGAIPADTMIEALITKLAPFFPASVHFDGWTIFTKSAPDEPALPRAFKTNSTVGTATATWAKATQATFTAKTVAAGEAKIVLMDNATGNSFDRITQASLTTDAQNFLNEWFADTNGWAGRDGSRPYYFQQIAFTLNEKLRRAYHMN